MQAYILLQVPVSSFHANKVQAKNNMSPPFPSTFGGGHSLQEQFCHEVWSVAESM